MKEIEMLDPTGVPKLNFVPLAPRVDSLRDKTVGLLGNGKPNAMPILESLAKLLSQRYRLGAIVRLDRGDDRQISYRVMGKVDGALVDFVAKLDVVLSGIGD